jgi:GGDEF domain-containing protein
VTAARADAEDVALLRGLLRDTAHGATPDLALSVALRRICAAAGWDFAQLWLPDGAGTLRCSPAWFTVSDGAFEAIRTQRADRPAGGLRPARSVGGHGQAAAPRCRPGERSSRQRAAELSAAQVVDAVSVPLLDQGETVAVIELMSLTARPARSRALALLSAPSSRPGSPCSAPRDASRPPCRTPPPAPEPPRGPKRFRLPPGGTRSPAASARCCCATGCRWPRPRAERHDSGVAVFAVDLDRLAGVNAARGRRPVTRCSSRSPGGCMDILRSTDTCARTQDDEFVVVCEEFDAAVAAFPAADRIVSALGRPYVLADGTALTLTACVGAAVGEEGAYEDTDVLLYRASRALAAAKSAGGARAVVDVSGPTSR